MKKNNSAFSADRDDPRRRNAARDDEDDSSDSSDSNDSSDSSSSGSSTSSSDDSSATSSASSSDDSSDDSSASSSDGSSSDGSSAGSSGSESSDWGSDSESESEAEDADKAQEAPGPSRWLKTADDTAAQTAKVKQQKERPVKKEKEKVEKDEAKEAASILRARDVPLFAADEVVDATTIEAKLQEVVAARGRKGHDRVAMIRHLTELVTRAREVTGPQMELGILSHLIAAYFDATPGAFAAMSINHWMAVYGLINRALELIVADSSLYCAVVLPEEDDESDRDTDAPVNRGDGQSTSALLKNSSSKDQQEGGGATEARAARAQRETALLITRFLLRLDDEVTKSLQFTDVHTEDFKVRLGHTSHVLQSLWHAFSHFRSAKQMEAARIVSLRILEHVYYRRDQLGVRTWELIAQRLPEAHAAPLRSKTPMQIFNDLIDLNLRVCCTDAEEQEEQHKVAVRCVLYAAYYHALHGRYNRARDLLAVGNLHEHALQCNISTQILYNRVLVQLGLAAFCQGLIAEAHGYLSEVCSMGRYRELLAQGFSNQRGVERTPEQESVEKRRLLPYQLHIPADLVEAVHNVAAMLLEVPAMASQQADRRPRIVAKNFRKLLDAYDRQVLTGPPESQRDYILAATKALQQGDWQSCVGNLESLTIWSQLPEPENVKKVLWERVKVEGLKTYILTNVSIYDSFSVTRLCAQFALSRERCYSTVNGLLVQSLVAGCWSADGEFVLLQRTYRTPMQTLAAGLAEKIASTAVQRETLEAFKNPKFLAQAASKDERRPWERRFNDDDRGGAGRVNRYRVYPVGMMHYHNRR